MDWINLNSEEQLQEIKNKSIYKPQVIFKHSSRCSLSSVAKNRLDKVSPPDGIDFYFLDLIKHRDISNKISREFDVYHESPQILLIKNGESVYDESHTAINMQEIAEHALVA
ncbi:MAG: bacillithiol system redox-active protein YtxJ [Ginsengibacter sp.]